MNATTLTATISAADIQSFNPSVPVIVVNPAPGGGTSNTFFFNVTTPVAVLSTLVPNSAIAGGAAFTLTVNGSNFENNAVVQWNGGNRTTTFVSATQLTAAITAADIASVGTASVVVFNPLPVGSGASGIRTQGAPAGTFSNTVTFTIERDKSSADADVDFTEHCERGSSCVHDDADWNKFRQHFGGGLEWSGATDDVCERDTLTATISAADVQDRKSLWSAS